jgi:hypothetical protein
VLRLVLGLVRDWVKFVRPLAIHHQLLPLRAWCRLRRFPFPLSGSHQSTTHLQTFHNRSKGCDRQGWVRFHGMAPLDRFWTFFLSVSLGVWELPVRIGQYFWDSASTLHLRCYTAVAPNYLPYNAIAHRPILTQVFCTSRAKALMRLYRA